MASDRVKEVVVTAEDAVFWLDRWGYWCNRDGRFEHRKIIAYFHASIGRDENGYFVSQINGDIREKVYFRYEDTALFVFDVTEDDPVYLVLNTGRRIPLDPVELFIRRDALYLRHQDELIKFNEPSMLKMATRFEDGGNRCFLVLKGKRWAIPVEEA